MASDEEVTLNPSVNEHDHIRNAPHGAVTLVEYGDFECPDCGRTFPTVKKLLENMPDVRFVFRNYPLPQHPHAVHAAEAAEAAGTQGKFWEMHDYLFEHQNALSDRHLMEAAQEIDLDTKRFLHEMQQNANAQKVQDDIASGDESGVMGTPTFYINGVRYDGPDDVASLSAALKVASR